MLIRLKVSEKNKTYSSQKKKEASIAVNGFSTPTPYVLTLFRDEGCNKKKFPLILSV